jgi:hypothetical protein
MSVLAGTVADMTVDVRMMGDPEEIRRIVARLREVVEVAWDGQTYDKRRGFGKRAYLEVREHAPVANAEAHAATGLDAPPARE